VVFCHTSLPHHTYPDVLSVNKSRKPLCFHVSVPSLRLGWRARVRSGTIFKARISDLRFRSYLTFTVC